MLKFNKLSKAEMKNVVGAFALAAPSAPIAGMTEDELTVEGDGGGGYKCCWNDQPSNCSSCVSNATSSWTCVSGATLTAC